MYLKIILCASIIAFSLKVSSFAAMKSKKDADTLRAMAHEFMLFKDGIVIKNLSVKEMSNEVTSQNKAVKAFFDSSFTLMCKYPEMPLNNVFSTSVNTLELSKDAKRQLINELNYISSLFDRHNTEIFLQGINNSCARLIEFSDSVMDKYKRDSFLYKRVGILFGMIICMFIF